MIKLIFISFIFLLFSCDGKHTPNWEIHLVKNYTTKMGEPDAPFECKEYNHLQLINDEAYCSVKISSIIYRLHCYSDGQCFINAN
jgi:hypothetical protein